MQRLGNARLFRKTLQSSSSLNCHSKFRRPIRALALRLQGPIVTFVDPNSELLKLLQRPQVYRGVMTQTDFY